MHPETLVGGVCAITELAIPTLEEQAVPVTQDIPLTLYSVVDLSKEKRNRDTNSSTIVSCCVALS